MKLPSSLTTVTLFSKILAVIIFFTFIISAFFIGMKYQATIDSIRYQQANLITAKPSPTPKPTANWKTYINTSFGYSFRYPQDILIEEEDKSDIWIDRQININVYDKEQVCQGGCPWSDQSEKDIAATMRSGRRSVLPTISNQRKISR